MSENDINRQSKHTKHNYNGTQRPQDLMDLPGRIHNYGYNLAQMELNQNLAPAQKKLIVLNILKYK